MPAREQKQYLSGLHEEEGVLNCISRHLSSSGFDSSMYMSAYVIIKFAEDKMISQENFLKMANAQGTPEALGFVGSSSLAERLEDTPGGYEEAILKERRWLLNFLDTYIPEGKASRLFRLEHDFHNLKILVKIRRGWLEEEEGIQLFSQMCSSSPEELKDCLVEEDFGKVISRHFPEHLELLEGLKIEFLEEDLSDTLLDHLMLHQFRKQAQSLKSKTLDEIVRVKLDFSNIRLLVRGLSLGKEAAELTDYFLLGGRVQREILVAFYRKASGARSPEERQELFHELQESFVRNYSYYFPIGSVSQQARLDTDLAEGFEELTESGSLFALEKLFDNLVVWNANMGRRRDFTIDPVLSFAFGKLAEMQNFAIALTGKQNRMEPQRIRTLLRDSYGSSRGGI